LDKSTNNRNQRNARKDIEGSDKQIQLLNTEIDALNAKNIVLSDSVNVYNVKAIELKAGSEVAGEVGPLKYVSELTGTPMANVVNYMILLLIFVFDPLAIALILATNRVFELEGKQTPLEPKIDYPEMEVVDIKPTPGFATTIVEVIKEKTKSEGVNEGINEGVKIDEETGKLNLLYDAQINDEDYILMSKSEEPILEDEQHDDAEIDAVSDVVNDAVNDESTTVSDKSVEVPIYKKQPVVTTGKVNLEDIKEIKEGRGFSVEIPNPKTNNTIERIGSNKIVKNGDNNKVYFKRG
jgi:hypothetical protein